MHAPPATALRPNPVLRGFHPDPTVCRVGNLYVCATSTFAWCPGLPIYISPNLVDWTLVSHALPHPPGLDSLSVGDGLYAPGLRHDGSRFLLACTIVDRKNQRFRNFIVNATDPAGPWSSPIWLPEDLGRIDPTPFIDDDGRLYIVLNEKPPVAIPNGGNRVIKLWELHRETFQPIAGPWLLWDGAMKNAATPEAPRIYRRDGWYYLLIAEGGTGLAHAVTMARARQLQGPWEPCPNNPLFTHRHLGPDFPLACVGHADLVQAPDNSWWALALATRQLNRTAPLNRETVLLPVTWNPNEWPVFAPGIGQVPPSTSFPQGPTLQTKTAPLPWLGLRSPSPLIQHADHLELPANPIPLHSPTGIPALAARRITELTGSFSARIGTTDPTLTAGITLFADDRSHVRIELRGNIAHVITFENANRLESPPFPAHENLQLTWNADGITAHIGPATHRAADLSLLARADFTGPVAALFAQGPSGSLQSSPPTGQNWQGAPLKLES